LSFLAGNYLHC